MLVRRHKRLILSGVIIGILAFGIASLVLTGSLHREPRCRGIPLSDWLIKAKENDVGVGIAEIGPTAIPFLARTLVLPNPLWNKFYIPFWKAFPGKLRTYLPSPDTAERVRRNALFALKEFGPEAKPALPYVLATARNDPSVFCRTFAVNAAVAIGYDEPVVARMFAELLKKPSSTDAAAMAPYNAARFPSNCLAEFIGILENKQKQPHSALLGLSVLGPGACDAVPLIVPALNDPKLQGNALTAIFRIGPCAEPAIPALINLLEEEGSVVNASEALMNIGPGASNAIPALKRLMTNDEVTTRIMAAVAVAKISSEPKESLPVIIRGLEPGRVSNESWTAPIREFGLDHYAFNYRLTAAWFLGELGTNSGDALLALKKNLINCPEWLAPALARSIWKLEGRPQEVITILRESLKAKDNETRVIACTTLAEMGPAAVDALPDLLAASRMSLNTRQAVIFAMRKIKPGSTVP